MNDKLNNIIDGIRNCTECALTFSDTETQHKPRPVIQLTPTAKIAIIGQAPGMRVYKSGLPFDDASGDRLRDWMGIDRDVFYNDSKIAIIPMGFCFPGYDKRGSDIPPPPICAKKWRTELFKNTPRFDLTLLIGMHAQKWHLGTKRKKSLTETVENWREYTKLSNETLYLPLPHPSWRNTGWIKKNPWFTSDTLPFLKSSVASALA